MPRQAPPLPTALVLYENGPDWRYATGTPIADPALCYISPKGKTHIVVSELEIELMRHEATRADRIHSFADIRKKMNGTTLSVAAMVEVLMGLEKTPPARIVVPRHFPAGLMEKLREAKLPVMVAETELVFPARALKTEAEIKHLRAAQALNEHAMECAFAILRAADIRRDKTLVWNGAPLTSEILRAEMNMFLVRHGATEFHGGPIIAGGSQATMPHHRGSGPLKAGELIIIDTFPRHPNGYWGDLTRTVIKGQPSAWQKEIYYTVLEAQKLALSLIKPGVNGADVHEAVATFFTRAGFPTGTHQGQPYGYFHGTGHGVGLDLHDPGPRTLSSVPCTLQAGMVTSVEPGLYYPQGVQKAGFGGVRIEDVVTVTTSGVKNLTKRGKTQWILD